MTGKEVIIREILNVSIICNKEKFQLFPIDLDFNTEYIVKCEINSKYQHMYEINIINYPLSKNIIEIELNKDILEKIYSRNFIDSICERFKVEILDAFFPMFYNTFFNIILQEVDNKLISNDNINGFKKEKSEDIIKVKLIEINLAQLKKLKISSEKLDQIDTIIEKYFKGNEIDAMRDIGVFTEFIAQKLVEKIEKKKISMDFSTMVNKLCNTSKKERKYNYNYLGSSMYPIYFLRNEISHGKNLSKNVEINNNHTKIVFYLFMEILNYIAEKQISVL